MTSTDNRGGPRTAPAPARSGGRRTTRPRLAAGAGALALGLGAAALVAVPALAIDSNPPTGPGTIEIFPKRDMVAIEGYSEYSGKQATISVLRGGTLVGSAVGTVDSTGFLEVNHPGGVCWGAGTGLAVTPDIVGGDEIRVDFAGTGGRWDGATTSDVEITDIVRDDATNSLTLNGRYGPGIVPPGADPVLEPGRMQVEIVNPEMRDATSGVGERAIGWPAGDEVPVGYTVTGSTTGSTATGGTFSATFGFRDSRDLDLAEAGEAVALAWQAEAPPELGIEAFYGLTLFEYHEASGPGFGGCPAGPEGQRAASPSSYTGTGAGEGSISVDWAAVAPLPGAPAVTGYSVRAVTNDGDETGKRVGAATTEATLGGLEPGETYDVEISSRTSAGESGAPAVMRLEASPHVAPAATATTARTPNAEGKYQPLVTTATGVDYGVHLDPVRGVNGAEVHYTVDGSTPTLSSPTFKPGFDEGIQVRQDTTIRWVVVDSGNIVGAVGSKFFDIVDAVVEPPAVTRLAPLDSAVDVTFQTRPGATAYRVQAYDASGTVRVGALVNAPVPADPAATEVTRRMAGLTNGTGYTFTAAARIGTAWTAESPVSTVVAPVPAPRANAGAVQTVLRGRTATLDGSASIGAVGYQWVQLRPAGTAGAPQDQLVTLTGATTARPTFRVPTLTGPTTDHTLQFRLTITLADGTTKVATTSVNAQADAVTATEARWRAGNPLRMGGTGSQENAVLTFRDATPAGALIGTATVVGGEWVAPAATVNLTNGSIHVWSDFGYVGTIQTTR